MVRLKLRRFLQMQELKRATCCVSYQRVKNFQCRFPDLCLLIGTNCHELRINDKTKTWRLIYRIDEDAIIILEVFEKKTPQTPKRIIEICKKRIKEYDND